jgi:hypothetical protein
VPEENVEIMKRAIEQWNKGERIPDEEIHPDANPSPGREGGITLDQPVGFLFEVRQGPWRFDSSQPHVHLLI